MDAVKKVYWMNLMLHSFWPNVCSHELHSKRPPLTMQRQSSCHFLNFYFFIFTAACLVILWLHSNVEWYTSGWIAAFLTEKLNVDVHFMCFNKCLFLWPVEAASYNLEWHSNILKNKVLRVIKIVIATLE